ncbi:DUF3368 domain-containing protein [Thermodesulfovibrio sp. 3462-1]|uniref:DUF3368 domain-containing protein n=1 Tax=Thermodesulfovibrio obliviosus TaxID=3118332 RepID=A0AAU8H4A4_9BACT
MHDRIIADTSVLIALEKINLLDLLCKIYKEVIIPEGVLKEFGSINLGCFSTKSVDSKLVNLFIKEMNLGKGEAEVIALSYNTGIPVLIDDLRARKLADEIGLTVSGTIGVLMKAQKMGIIESALEKVLELKKMGFYISDEIIRHISRFY